MAQVAPFLFDLDFSAPPEPEIEEEIEEIPPEPMITVAEHERLLAAAIENAHAEGENKAREAREQLAVEERLQLEKTMLDEIAMIYTEVGHLMRRLERDSSQLAFTFASRFAERLVAQEPKQEIQALLNQILAPLRKTPHLSIRLNEAVAEEIKDSVEAQMQELGFEGKLAILPDPTIMPGDCEVEWADGGIGRNLRSAIHKVEQLVEDHFADVPPPEDPPEPEQEQEQEQEPEAQTDDADAADTEALQGEHTDTEPETRAEDETASLQNLPPVEEEISDQVEESEFNKAPALELSEEQDQLAEPQTKNVTEQNTGMPEPNTEDTKHVASAEEQDSRPVPDELHIADGEME